jgi:hypothetical protein
MRCRIVLCVAVFAIAASGLHAQEPHGKVLPTGVDLVLLGSYTLDKPTSKGEKEIHVTIVDGKIRLRDGEAENLMIYEGVATEAIGGVKSADVYRFSVVGRPGVLIQFKVLNNRLDYLFLVEDFAKPPVVATGRRKRR